MYREALEPIDFFLFLKSFLHLPLLATRETEDVETILEKERSRLARELHDSVSQQLFAASMLLSSMTEQDHAENPVVEQQLKQVEQMIQQSQLEMRALLLHLRPIALDRKSVV